MDHAPDEPRLKVAALLVPLALAGCMNIGAARLGVDRSDYANRLRETNKEQLLQNVVAMRYGDAPLFLEVSSVISQYTREGSVRADVVISPPPDDTNGGIGGSILLRETPTVTYTPLAGERFARSMMAPLSPASLLAMVEAGWSAEPLFRVAARSINGVGSGAGDPLFAGRADPDFDRVLAALGRLQRSEALRLHVERDGGNFRAVAHPGPNPSESDRADLAFLTERLRLPGDRKGEFRIVFGDVQAGHDQLAIGTRSMFEIFAEMAQGVDIPASDAGLAVGSDGPGRTSLIRIHSGTAAPPEAHVAIRHRGHWFWIAGDDAASKRTFLIAQVLLTLNDSSGGAAAPLVTIPTG